jgi:threonine dehydratase
VAATSERPGGHAGRRHRREAPGEVTRPLVDHWLDGVVTVDEDDIADAMVLLMERAKLYVEGAGAVGVAALLSGPCPSVCRGLTCVVLSGGNVDLGVVPALIRRHETRRADASSSSPASSTDPAGWPPCWPPSPTTGPT